MDVSFLVDRRFGLKKNKALFAKITQRSLEVFKKLENINPFLRVKRWF